VSFLLSWITFFVCCNQEVPAKTRCSVRVAEIDDVPHACSSTSLTSIPFAWVLCGPLGVVDNHLKTLHRTGSIFSEPLPDADRTGRTFGSEWTKRSFSFTRWSWSALNQFLHKTPWPDRHQWQEPDQFQLHFSWFQRYSWKEEMSMQLHYSQLLNVSVIVFCKHLLPTSFIIMPATVPKAPYTPRS